MEPLFSAYHFTIYSAALLVTTHMALLVAGASWQRRTTPGAIYLALMSLAIAQWAFSILFESAATTVPLKLLWSQIAYVGTTPVAVLYALFVFGYIQLNKYLTRRNVTLAFVVPVLTVLAAFTNDWHHLLWSSIVINPANNIAVYGHGPVFWIFIAYIYVMIAIGLITLYRSTLHLSAFYVTQARLLLLASTLPVITSILYVAGLDPIPGLEWTPIAFALTGAILAWSIFRRRMLDLVPIARAQLIESMVDGVLVLDMQERVMDINPAAQHLLCTSTAAPLGLPVRQVFAGWPGVDVSAGSCVTIDNPSCGDTVSRRTLEVQMSPLHDRKQRPIGRLLVLRDVTQRRQIEEALSGANGRLQQQLDEIRVLQDALRADAIHDVLTGTYNRRYLMETLQRSLHDRRPLNLVMMDLDHLKALNDTYGHGAGDVMLRELASMLRGYAHDGDAVCRYGGDEFVVLLPDLRLEEAQACAALWRERFESIIVDYGGVPLHSTISLGVVNYPDCDTGPDGLLAAADQALYAAKSTGRNRMAVWRPGILSETAHAPAVPPAR